MKRPALIFLVLLLSLSAGAQTRRVTGVPMYYEVTPQGDTMFLDTLEPVWCLARGKGMRDGDWRKYYKMVYNFNKVYPYALVGRKMMAQVDSTIRAWDSDYTNDYATRGAWTEMMKEEKGIPFDLSLAFHTDAGMTPDDGIIGTLSIYTLKCDGKRKFKDGSDRMSCRMLSEYVQDQIVEDVREDWEPQWNRRMLWDRSYSESRTTGVPAVLLELLSHQNFADMKYGKSQPDASRKIRSFIKKNVTLPDGAKIEYGGLTQINKAVAPEILVTFIAALAILFFFLFFHFKKANLAILTLVMSSLCLFGASLGMYIFKLDFGLTAVLGLISLVGIIVRNGIILFEYAEYLHFEEGLSVRDAAFNAGARRMRPIFLTSCTTALGVLPMIISGDLLWMPMGLVICFGTLMSIFLIVLVMPVSYWQVFSLRGKDA